MATDLNHFDAFWAAWPSGYKVGRKTAEAKWRSLRLDVLAETIIADVQRRQQEDRGWRDGFIPNPLTYTLHGQSLNFFEGLKVERQ